MVGLLKGEFFKLFRTRSFFLILAAAIIIGFGSPVLSEIVRRELSNISGTEKEQVDAILNSDLQGFQTGISVNVGDLYETPTVMSMLETSFTGNGFQLLLGIFAALFISIEFSTGSMKMIVSKGFFRTKIFVSKFLAICFANIVFVAVSVVGTYLSSLVLFEHGVVPEQFLNRFLSVIALEIAGIIAFSAVASMVSIICRNMPAAIIVNILIVAFAGNIANVLDLLTQKKFGLTDYWVINAMEAASSFSLSGSDILKISLTFLFTFLITFFIGVFSFRKAEIN